MKLFTFTSSHCALGFLFLGAWHSARAERRSIQLVPGAGDISPTFQDIITIPGSAFSSGDREKIHVKSNIPVSIMQFNASPYLIGESPIEDHEALIFVSTNCPNKYDSESVEVKYSENEDGAVGRVSIKVEARRGRRNRFLPRSSFEIKWDYSSYWCEAGRYEDDGDDGDDVWGDEDDGEDTWGDEDDWELSDEMEETNATKSRGGERRLSLTRRGLDRRDGKKRRQKRCLVHAEILLDGCYRDTIVIAPRTRLLDARIQDEQSGLSPDDKCLTEYNATLAFPGREKPIGATISVPVQIPALPEDSCWRAIEGRPFRDSTNRQLQGEALFVATSSSWSTKMDNTKSKNLDICKVGQGNTTAVPKVTPSIKAREIASVWTQRGLGEHASVASFAAFTMALMTNKAPADLVQDSLLAGLDEVNHAKISFQVASHFGGKIVEPGPLPSSSHKFEGDMTALALGTAREGCIDETLSALAAAEEADSYDDASDEEDYVGVTSHVAAILKEKLVGIALDEASHSALAWRTIRWVCSTDKEACQAVTDEALDTAVLESAASRRFPSGNVQEEWRKIYTSLVPFVTSPDDQGTLSPDLCVPREVDNIELEIGTRTAATMVDRIIRGVLCPESRGSLSS